jgi:hypothetical protein
MSRKPREQRWAEAPDEIDGLGKLDAFEKWLATEVDNGPNGITEAEFESIVKAYRKERATWRMNAWRYA